MHGRAIVVMLLAMAVPASVFSTPVGAAQTCFGLPATIADHKGDVEGTPGDDVMIGDDGDNDFSSQGGTDRICGGGGDDFVGYRFDAVIFAEGGPGDDWLIAGDGAGGPNELRGGPGDDNLTGSEHPDLLYGDKGDDLINGLEAQDYIHGGQGNDDIYGDDGNDHLFGEGGRDKLVGGDGRNFFSGGGGADKCYPDAPYEDFFPC